MSIITLTSDWQNQDYYAGAMKGAILKECGHCSIIDITHSVKPFHSHEAAFIVKNVYKSFPDNTIHIIDVKSEPSEQCSMLIVKVCNQYFIGADNGMFGLMFDDEPEEIIRINMPPGPLPQIFPGKYVFASVAAKILNNIPIKDIGEPVEEYSQKTSLRPSNDDSTIKGTIIYIDSYYNVITNISKEMFDKIRKGRPFEIFIQNSNTRIDKINDTYTDKEFELIALFNSIGLLEIAVYNGAAAKLMGLEINSWVKVKFYNDFDVSQTILT